MSIMTTHIIPSPLIQGPNHSRVIRSLQRHLQISNIVSTTKPIFSTAIQYPYHGFDSTSSILRLSNRCFNRFSAVGSGLEASITDKKANAVSVKDAKILVESQDVDKIQISVQVCGEETQKVFDKVLANLASSAPPIPGFRRQKGGKTSKVPKSFLLQVLGEERVTKFVIQEIVNSTMADYVEKENLNVMDKKINTTQTAEELKKLFAPGKEFGFNAILELEKPETETTSSSTSET